MTPSPSDSWDFLPLLIVEMFYFLSWSLYVTIIPPYCPESILLRYFTPLFSLDGFFGHTHNPIIVKSKFNIPQVFPRAESLWAQDPFVAVNPFWVVRELPTLTTRSQAGQIFRQDKLGVCSVWVQSHWHCQRMGQMWTDVIKLRGGKEKKMKRLRQQYINYFVQYENKERWKEFL